MTFSNPLLLLLAVPLWLGTVWAWAGHRGWQSGTRRVLALIFRLLIFTLLLLALAGAAWSRPSSQQAVAFVDDLSASTAGAQNQAVRSIDQALHAGGTGDLAAVIATGRDAVVEQGPAHLGGFSGFNAVVDPSFTNLDVGLSLGGAVLPDAYRKRVVLLTDGRQNLGDAVAEARVLRSQGIRVDAVALSVPTQPDVRVSAVDAPGSIHIGERFPLTVLLHSTVKTSLRLQVYEDDQLVLSAGTAVAIGDSALSYTLTAKATGVHAFRVIIEPAIDAVPENNEGSTYVAVTGPPRVLVVEGAPGFAANVVASLRAAHMIPVTISAAQMPQSLSGFEPYAAVVLVDASADLLGSGALTSLQSYVHDLGRGLVVTGGVNSFAAGNYANTALEAALPVTMQLPKRKDIPSAAVVLIIESLESNASVNISKQAGKGVLSLLTPEDQLAVSDATSGFVVHLQHVTDPNRVARAIDAMNPGDPDSYVPYLNDALAVLRRAQAQTKQIILLGDGDAFANYGPTLATIVKAGIHVSTIETNAASAQEFNTMETIARLGGGRYYPADNPATIPQVFLKVAREVAHSSIREQLFYPIPVGASQILPHLQAVPALSGYVITTPKSRATVVLASPQSDPVLAQWQYGLGRVVAWTSDAQGRWSADWLRDPRTRMIWASMVNWTLPAQNGTGLQLSTSISAGLATITLSDVGSTSFRTVTARVVSPGNQVQTLTLQPTAPDQYQAQMAASAQGSYLLEVRAVLAGGATQSVSGGFVVPYSPDYADSGTDLSTISAIAAAGGGQVLHSPRAAFALNEPPVTVATPLQTGLLLLALVLLPLDIATRRVVLTAAEWRALARSLRRRRSREAAAASAWTATLTVVQRRRSRADRVGADAAEEATGATQQGEEAAGATQQGEHAVGTTRQGETAAGATRQGEKAAGTTRQGEATAGDLRSDEGSASARNEHERAAEVPPAAGEVSSSRALLEAKRRRQS